jgi:hypothetical protein
MACCSLKFGDPALGDIALRRFTKDVTEPSRGVTIKHTTLPDRMSPLRMTLTCQKIALVAPLLHPAQHV